MKSLEIYAAKGRKRSVCRNKKQATDVVAQEAQRAGAYYVNRRWLGGMMTNFETIRGRVNKLRELESLLNQVTSTNFLKKKLHN